MVKSPSIAFVSGLILIAYGIYGIVSHVDEFMQLSRYQSGLTMLDIETTNMATVLDQLKELIISQQANSNSIESALSTLNSVS
ncbi:unnamed protein product [Adineta ricciae]|uniref:Uncharacterized protein n=1 Tax=Adineta ricciae TaxID=249248 RepID=A0A814V1M5_ADIRI|nr:unnamed protein product [Adineta ricciae]